MLPAPTRSYVGVTLDDVKKDENVTHDDEKMDTTDAVKTGKIYLSRYSDYPHFLITGLYTFGVVYSVTRLDDLLDFVQVYKAFGNN